MKLLVALLVALLMGCATAVDPRIVEYVNWERTSYALAESGQMRWTSYYAEGYERLEPMPASVDRDMRMMAFAQLAPIARQYEAGQLTQEQFDDQRRLVSFTARQAAIQAYAQQQASESADMATRLQIMRTLQPRPVVLPPVGNPSVNCTSRAVGNAVQTNCF